MFETAPGISIGTIENESDSLLSRLLGDNLMAATLRMMVYLAIAAAIVAALSLAA